MLKKLLIANRGEIACRIIRTARRLGIVSVLAVSEADRRSLAAGDADEVVLIGTGPATDSYLRGDRVIEAARRMGCDAIHPGYGFLSENADFADAVAAAGLVFVGPPPAAMRALGGKAAAKAAAIDCAIPVVPGYQGADQDLPTLRGEARRIGYPVLIKAVDGGGGRGMRLVEREADFAEALASAQREARSAFGSDRVLIEKLVVAPRHVEVQVFGDAHGNVVHLFERDCSLQRRNQKVIEEAPAPGMPPELRARMTDAAVKLARAVGYQNAGTVEFLVEGGRLTPDARWYFIEMNTRLQVEHPVTEEITGLDLVEWQLRVASGDPLPLAQDRIAMRGHAIEARLNAEDAASGFMPSVGHVVAFAPPVSEAGTRVETGVQAGSEVSPFYDSMIAKLIGSGPDRATALARLDHLVETTTVAGPRTNGAFLRSLLADSDVQAGVLDTGLIARKLDGLTTAHSRAASVEAGMVDLMARRRDDAGSSAGLASATAVSPWAAIDAFQLGPPRTQQIAIVVDGTPTLADVTWSSSGPAVNWGGDTDRATHRPRRLSCHRDDDRVLVVADLIQTAIAWPSYDAATTSDETGNSLRAQINGRLAKIYVVAGQIVEKGDRIAIIEAMKMEHVLAAARAGTILRVEVQEGAQVAQGTVIAELDAE